VLFPVGVQTRKQKTLRYIDQKELIISWLYAFRNKTVLVNNIQCCIIDK
jgi:hypothetical protein